MRGALPGILFACAAAAVGAAAGPAAGPAAVPAAGPEDARWGVRTTAPFAVRGGILAVELEPRTPPAAWPPSVQVRGAGGLELNALVGVVVPAPRPGAPRWTSPVDPIEVLTPEEFRARLAQSTAPIDSVVVALAPLPPSHPESMEVAGVAVKPRWLAAPSRVNDPAKSDASDGAPTDAGSDVSIAADARRDDLPAPELPSEYWRRVLLAQAEGRPAPPPPFTGPANLLARQRAELWQAGLARIGATSASVVAELVELLTARVEDPERPPESRSIAAWISRPGELDALLGLLLDPQRNAESAMRAALGWMDSRTPLTCWIESDAGGAVTLAVANPLPEEVVVRCAWLEAPRDAPLALLAAPRRVSRQSIERPAAPAAAPPGRTQSEPVERWRAGLNLRLECRGWKGQLPVGPGHFAVRPPGLAFASFAPVLTLASAQSQRIDLPTTPWRTTASLRRLGPRWELFVECLRPQPSPGDRVEVSLLRGDESGRRFTVDERGAVTMLEGEANGALVAHAKSHADRWRVRLELPDAWLPGLTLGEPERILRISIDREPGGGQGRQSAGLPVPPWRPPAPIGADPAAWREMPVGAGR